MGLLLHIQGCECAGFRFYGMREFIIRDINGFWVTFGQPVQTNS